VLAEALDAGFRIDKEISRLSVYAGMLADQDTREAGPQGMQQEMQQLAADFKAQSSYVEPELVRVGLAILERFIEAEPRLRIYSFYLHDLIRRARHTLSDSEEKILADVMPLAASGHNIYNILTNADFPYPTITLSDGRTARVDPSGYAELRTLPHRADRQTAMSTFLNSLGGFQRTFGTTTNANVQRMALTAKARKYGSHLEAALDGPNIPVTVYHRLIDGINRWLPSFHRYLKLRRRMMGISDQLRYFDLYAPLVSEVQLTFTPEQAQEKILDALRPLGREYCDVVRRSFTERWIDFFPTTGKRSGAYSEGGA
jgi:oligoendopeptidase F